MKTTLLVAEALQSDGCDNGVLAVTVILVVLFLAIIYWGGDGTDDLF